MVHPTLNLNLHRTVVKFVSTFYSTHSWNSIFWSALEEQSYEKTPLHREMYPNYEWKRIKRSVCKTIDGICESRPRDRQADKTFEPKLLLHITWKNLKLIVTQFIIWSPGTLQLPVPCSFSVCPFRPQTSPSPRAPPAGLRVCGRARPRGSVTRTAVQIWSR